MEQVFDGKIDMQKYAETWTDNGMAKRKLDYEFYLERDCSEEALNKVLIDRYGATAKYLRKDRSFNIWRAFSFLKTYCGINNVELQKQEYYKRMDTITELLRI